MNPRIFDGLDSINWAALHHAYGPAVDTAQTLRELISDDEEMRATALNHLSNTVFHQGALDQSTAFTVPFLIRLIQVPDLSLQQEIFDLLYRMAQSYSESLATLTADQYADDQYRAELATWRSTLQQTRAALLNGYAVYVSFLNDPNTAIRKTAISMIAELNERVTESEPLLTQSIEKETDSRFKSLLISALGELWFRSAAEHVIFNKHLMPNDQAFLLRYMRAIDESSDVRFAAALEVVRLWGEAFIHEVIPIFNESLVFIGGSTPSVNPETAGLLTKFSRSLSQLTGHGIPGEAMRALTRQAVGNPESRWSTLYMAHSDIKQKLQNQPKAALVWYQAGSQSSEPILRTEAALQMSWLCAVWRWMPDLVIPRLVEMLHDADASVRFRGAEALRGLGTLAKPALLAELQNPKAPMRKLIEITLAQINLEASQATLPSREPEILDWPLNRLIDELKQSVRKMQLSAHGTSKLFQIIVTLGRNGPAAKAAVPAMRELLQTSDDWSRIEAANALHQIAPDDTKHARSVLVYTVTYGVSGARLRAARMLWQIDPTQAALIATNLVEMLHEEAKFLTDEICEVLWQVDPTRADLIIPEFARILRSNGNVHARLRMLTLAGAMGASARSVLPEILWIIESERRVCNVGSVTMTIACDEALRQAAQNALKLITP